MIKGIGIDLVETGRIGEMIQKHGAHFTGRIFTDGEMGYARGRKRRLEHLAARFAAKEAVAKALGRGMTEGINWQDIEVVHDPSGEPKIKLAGAVGKIAKSMGIRVWHLTLTHVKDMAVAMVVAEGSVARSRTERRGRLEKL